MPGDKTFTYDLHMYYRQLLVKPVYPTKSYTGKNVIVTGANTGLGLEAARHFVRLGAAKVIIACRSIEKGEAAKASVEQTTGRKGVVEVWQLDLASFPSVKQFAARAEKELSRIDVLLENAGLARRDYEAFEGMESQLTVNVISTFLLAFLLLPKLKETAEKFDVRPNLTVVSSDTHFFVDFDERKLPETELIKSMGDEKTANMATRYPTSKLLEVYMVREMAARKPDYPVTINLVNPGLCHSELARRTNWVFTIYKFLIARTTEVGSRTLMYAAGAGPETHGEYTSDCAIAMPATVVVSAKGQTTQKKVWNAVTAKLESIQPGVTGNL